MARTRTRSRSRFRLRRRPAPAPIRAKRPAAGVLLHIADRDGDWYLLGKRAKSLGGTWANFGGSLDPGEAPLTGALRELHEEIEMPASALVGAVIRRVVESKVSGSDETYTLFVLDVAPAVEDTLLRPGWEVSDVTWWHADAVGDLDLHSGFRAQWEAIR